MQYRKLSLIHHPNKGGTNKNFQELSNAYNYLIDYQNNINKCS